MTSISEIVERRAAGESVYEIAHHLGIGFGYVRKLLAEYERGQAEELRKLPRGAAVYEIESGKRWVISGPSPNPGCVRVVSDGGAEPMDMGASRLSTQPPEDKPSGVRALFSVDRSDDPNDPKFKDLIEPAMWLRKELDRPLLQTPLKADPVANLNRTVAAKNADKRAERV